MIARKRKRLEEIAQLLSDSQAVQAAQAALQAAEARLKPLKTRQRDLELQLQSARQKHKATEERLYSGAVRNPKELQDMQQEIATLRRRDAELQDQELEVMVAIDEAQAEVSAAQAHLEQAQAQLAERHGELFAEKLALERDLGQLEGQRQQISSTIQPEHLKLYASLKPGKGGHPVASLKGTHCSACGIEQTSVVVKAVKSGEPFTYCTNCRRILVFVG
ncbi:MAG: hypothetical protein NZ750_08545 [Anaerolineae bacterium]|nr:hypothetical protein [Anaerolineae bacterium]